MKSALISNLILLTAICAIWLLPDPKLEPKQSLIDNIATSIIKHTEHLDSSTIHELLVSHYKILGLINEEGIWIHPDLEAITEDLLPTLTNEDLHSFINEVTSQQKQNPYLVKFLDDPAVKDFIPGIRAQADLIGDTLFPQVVTFAIILDQLTQAMLEDTEIFTLCINIFTEKKETGWYDFYINSKEAHKLSLVADMTNRLLSQIQTGGPIEPSFLIQELQENINWAVEIDDVNGFHNNAFVGKTLSRHHPNYDGNSPPSYTNNNSVIMVQTPQPHQWTNLYITWNMAFVSSDYHFPFLITKLLIPTISTYRDQPGLFPQARALSLYTYMHYHFLERLDYNHKDNPHGTIELPIPLIELWGKINAESSAEYVDLVTENSTKDPFEFWDINNFISKLFK